MITSGGEKQPRQRLSFSNAEAYGRRLGQLIHEVRQQAYRLSCSHAACLSPEQLPFVMVEPWIGAASSCAPSAMSREAHRMIMDGVKHALTLTLTLTPNPNPNSNPNPNPNP